MKSRAAVAWKAGAPLEMLEGRIIIDDLITHKLPLERINEGFDLMKRGESIRAVVERSAMKSAT